MPVNQHPGYRIFILGAGFSVPAGLPLATELYPLAREHIASSYGTETIFDRDVDAYLAYCDAVGHPGQTKESLDLEKLMSYLDIEHYLGLRGSDTWSSEGNESQLMIRKALGHVIHSRTPAQSEIPDVYLRFAESLSRHDLVLSLNYDLVLENALAAVGKPYRRFPFRFESVSSTGGTVDSDTDEVVLLKMHGSIDWVDDRSHLELCEYMKRQGLQYSRYRSVFDAPRRFGLQPLVEGLLPEDDDLRHLHCISDLEEFYSVDMGLNAPFLLSPSFVKFVYSSPVSSFWNGMGRWGGYNLGISIIGFSLPEHDEYIRIGLYQMLSNYGSWWDSPFIDNIVKDFVRFVDYRLTDSEQIEFKRRYAFADTNRSRFHFAGFGHEALDFLFNEPRTL